MNKVTLSDAELAKLRDAGRVVEVCDATGAVVGRFQSVQPEPFTAEEIAAAARATGPARPLADILRDYETR